MSTATDWIENRLEVTGPDQALGEFVMAAEGPGFVAWERPAGEDLAYWSALALEGGAPSPAAAHRLARRLEDKLWWAIEDARVATELGTSTAPLDLNALIPIPRKILRAGWHQAGREWCWENWGTSWSLRKVRFRFEHRRRRRSPAINVVAVYDFLSGDWSPWRSLLAAKARWPTLQFDLRPEVSSVAIDWSKAA